MGHWPPCWWGSPCSLSTRQPWDLQAGSGGHGRKLQDLLRPSPEQDVASVPFVGHSEPWSQARFSKTGELGATSGGPWPQSHTAKRCVDRDRRTAATFAVLCPHQLWESDLTSLSLGFHIWKVGVLPSRFSSAMVPSTINGGFYSLLLIS